MGTERCTIMDDYVMKPNWMTEMERLLPLDVEAAGDRCDYLSVFTCGLALEA